jgi:hypothetical protein
MPTRPRTKAKAKLRVKDKRRLLKAATRLLRRPGAQLPQAVVLLLGLEIRRPPTPILRKGEQVVLVGILTKGKTRVRLRAIQATVKSVLVTSPEAHREWCSPTSSSSAAVVRALREARMYMVQ